MFGSLNRLKQPRYTHTWGTLVHTKTVAGKEELEVDEITISWVPTDLMLRPLKLSVRPGTNLGLHETIKYAKENREHIDMWGPYEVWHGLAYRFKIQKEFLDSGVVGYQCVDTIGEAARKGNGCACIHAISDLDPAYSRERYPLVYFGASATENIVDRIMKSPVTIDGQKTHDWLLPRLGLCCDDINRRTYSGRIEPYIPGGESRDAEVASETGRTSHAVRARRQRLKLPAKYGTVLT
jgi:hypothetical protein